MEWQPLCCFFPWRKTKTKGKKGKKNKLCFSQPLVIHLIPEHKLQSKDLEVFVYTKFPLAFSKMCMQ